MRKRDANFLMMDRATASRTHQRWGGRRGEGFPSPFFPPIVGAASLNTSEAHRIGPDQVVHSLHLVRPNSARYLAFTRGGSDDGGKEAERETKTPPYFVGERRERGEERRKEEKNNNNTAAQAGPLAPALRTRRLRRAWSSHLRRPRTAASD
jgi:hypothetical protein